MQNPATGTIHHVELWVPDLTRAVGSWGWLLGELGYEPFRQWPEGQSWRSGATYIVLEQSPARTAFRHDRCRPGLNHLAFHVESTDRVDQLAADAPGYGWRLMFADQHPYAGGDQHYAAYLENADGFEVELVGPVPGGSESDGYGEEEELLWPVPPPTPVGAEPDAGAGPGPGPAEADRGVDASPAPATGPDAALARAAGADAALARAAGADAAPAPVPTQDSVSVFTRIHPDPPRAGAVPPGAPAGGGDGGA